MKFTTFLLESTDALDILDEYLLDPLKAYKITPSVYKELLKDYANDKELTLYRGMNFATEKDYNKFIEDIKDNKISIKSISSWTRHKQTAIQFAKTRPSYMEYMDERDMELISKATKENESVVGFRGVILKTTIKANTALDVNKTEIAKEDEIIIGPSELKIEAEFVYKNSDRIKNEGIDAILKKYLDKDEDTDYSMIINILDNHSDKLTDENKKQIGSYILHIDDERNIINVSTQESLTKKNNIEIIVRLNYTHYLEKYKDVFLKEDIENYKKIVGKLLSKNLDKILDILKDHKDPSTISIDWVTSANKIKLFKEFNVHDKYKQIVDFYADEYNKMNDEVSTKKTFNKKDIDSFTKQLTALLKNI